MPSPQRVVLITGTSSGFGRLIAETLARKGFQVFATMRSLNGRNAAAARELADLAKRESLSLQTLDLDVTDDASVERAVSKIALQCGRIDVLVNNAGFGIMDLAESVTMAQAQRQFDTNFFGVLRMNRTILPVMKRQGSGLLLHVSSGGGRLAIPGMGLYCASKFAMEALAETYRKSVRTVTTQLRYLAEYPEYRFACSQAQQYAWIEERDPNLWQRIRAAVGGGGFVPVGGTWVEPDCNIPSGESLARP